MILKVRAIDSGAYYYEDEDFNGCVMINNPEVQVEWIRYHASGDKLIVTTREMYRVNPTCGDIWITRLPAEEPWESGMVTA